MKFNSKSNTSVVTEEDKSLRNEDKAPVFKVQLVVGVEGPIQPPKRLGGPDGK